MWSILLIVRNLVGCHAPSSVALFSNSCETSSGPALVCSSEVPPWGTASSGLWSRNTPPAGGFSMFSVFKERMSASCGQPLSSASRSLAIGGSGQPTPTRASCTFSFLQHDVEDSDCRRCCICVVMLSLWCKSRMMSRSRDAITRSWTSQSSGE